MDAGRLLSAAGALALAAGSAFAAPPDLLSVATPGPEAIAAANLAARERSRSDRFVGGLQLFDYAPGRVYEVWTAPLRVTTLTLAPGETVTAMSAGDTVRWQIGETASGEGAARRVHVLVKPLERQLDTNLVLATSQRLYALHLRSGPPQTFNNLVAWDAGVLAVAPGAPPPPASEAAPPEPPVAPVLDGAYRIKARWPRPAWTPTAVMTDGVRTYIAFPSRMASGEAPALFAVAPDGEAQMVNYRQQGGLFVVDRVLEAAELRLGDRRPQVVRITRQAGARP
ncbi:TrbG/VirB9 family P-type conjugative transfer protein [Brevundimonas sp.]|uniref:TrbG/VirB9 family P-type conjugative transfer protein n=1 Tax=Brevundimonas sp. TaxID=1871086 RepID=UPI002FC64A19